MKTIDSLCEDTKSLSSFHYYTNSKQPLSNFLDACRSCDQCIYVGQRFLYLDSGAKTLMLTAGTDDNFLAASTKGDYREVFLLPNALKKPRDYLGPIVRSLFPTVDVSKAVEYDKRSINKLEEIFKYDNERNGMR